MPSPFPGMDPFIEGQAWGDFHTRLAAELSDRLVPAIRPRYVARIEERIYVEHHANGDQRLIRPDVMVLEREPVARAGAGAVGSATFAPAGAPITPTLPMPEQMREAFLTVRERETMAVVAVIEVLSPANKRLGSDGRREYLRKREAVLQSDAHLVEIDLLRAGEQPPTIEPLPQADYYAFVSRGNRRPKVEVYRWALPEPLPAVPVPLAAGDEDVFLDLQAAFASVYVRAGYDYSLDYNAPLEPMLPEDHGRWIATVVGAPESP